ncbi:hypothetical protein H8S17_02715 [Roseburia sp. BX1005]|uniref:DUF1700 domain-containing protein n=1 Tax=Roseburia zhanii TaxID=2763064 RepID=A0A923LNC5_9FIRM|nr:hypothetical protein [Roseburia zhanii]MBC5713134.1 hypothetical protein [Roseburia zhanii]
MNQKMKKKIKHYLHEISASLPAGYPNKKRLLRTLQQNIYDFLEEYPDADWEDVIKHFGASCDIAQSYIEEFSDTELAASYKTHHRHLFLTTVICCSALIALIISIYFFFSWWKNDALIVTETLTVYDGTEMWDEWESEWATEDEDAGAYYEVTK